MRPPTLGLVEAAELLKVHPKTLQKLARNGEVPACKVGRAWVFVEHLLLDTLVSKSISRVSVVDLQEKSECRSTDARTHRIGGSNYRPSGVNRSLYSKVLGLPIDERRRRSTTDSPTLDGSRPGSA
jgi:excisionase family DNA binding protein